MAAKSVFKTTFCKRFLTFFKNAITGRVSLPVIALFQEIRDYFKKSILILNTHALFSTPQIMKDFGAWLFSMNTDFAAVFVFGRLLKSLFYSSFEIPRLHTEAGEFFYSL